MSIRIMTGDCLEVMRTLPAASVQCCVTSPPYYGLRDYGCEGQIGLEETPEAYVSKMVEVFREVRRVLADDGTLWLNIGDSYSSSQANGGQSDFSTSGLKKDGRTEESRVRTLTENAKELSRNQPKRRIETGCKPKDLIGIPWMLATALRDPYYTGTVKDERDRVWLAAMLDAEGCISISEYETGDRLKSNVYIGITNSSVPIIEKCGRLFPQQKENVYQKGGVVNRTVFRWDVERMEQKSLFLREIYPHLVAKRKQAILGYTFIEMQRGLASKKKGYLPAQQEQRSWLSNAISILNKGGDVDLPDWTIEPPSLFEPGFYLRQDIIWHKPNPMPESVRDRCTKSHEYVFLLSKSARYFYDADAVAEKSEGRELFGNIRSKGDCEQRQDNDRRDMTPTETRNKRSVWSISTIPFGEAHFATMTPELAETCIKAGCPKGGTVLDPFGGAGTTALCADRLGRNALLIELNPAYVEIARKRLTNDAGMFAEVAA